MPRVLGARETMPPWAGGLVAAVVSFAALLRGATMSDLDLDTRLMAMTLMLLGLILLQWILGPRRRYSGHWLVQYGAMAAYYLPFPVAVYATNTVRYSSDTTWYHYRWCFSLLLWSLPVTHSICGMTAYAPGDSPFRDWRLLKFLFYSYSLFKMIQIGPSVGVADILLRLVGILLLFYLFTQRSPVTFYWKLGWSEQARLAKECADTVESIYSSPHRVTSFIDRNKDDPIIQKYGPWVMIMGVVDEWEIVSESPRTNNGTLDIDTVLSSRFCVLLTRRYFGFDCAEEGNEMVRDFMLKELMLPDCKRAFTIVEAQLALLHDYFFLPYQINWLSTAKAVPSKPLFMSIKILNRALLTLISSRWFIPLYYQIRMFVGELNFFPTVVIQLISILLSWCQEVYVFPTEWYTVIQVPKGTGSVCSNIPSMTNNTWFRRPPWKKEIGQYSLIEDYDRHSVKKMSLLLIKHLILGPPSIDIEHHPTEEDAVSLPDSVSQLVALTLRDINGPPTNGIRSLRRNRDRIMDDLSWTCRQRTHTHTILIWHIATCYMSPPNSYWPGNLRLVEISTCYEVATALSRYCAYLVAFLPEFLPEPKIKTQSLFQDVLKEAKTALSMMDHETTSMIRKLLEEGKRRLGLRRMSTEEKRIKSRGLELQEDETQLTTFEKGVKLGRQLEKLNTLLRWKVMAEFWAETILYIAPSDNVELHFNHLAKGGEFVTHIWAMLSNAGILKRAREEQSSSADAA